VPLMAAEAVDKGERQAKGVSSIAFFN